MPTITVNGKVCEFTPGQTIVQAANAAGVEIPQYCYHDGLSIVASCRICLAEIWAPDPKTGQIVPQMGGKLQPTCQTPATAGMVVYADSPKAVANQKAVMEFLLINHPLDCPVCDQSGECFLQDYSYQYGRGVSRFEEQKIKNPKKDVGPHVLLYSDRCIMCTRCVRFTREVTGSAELTVTGRGNKEEIDVFPGVPLDNPLSANVIDLCPVGALLDKDFLFAQRVWFLKSSPSIDGITASGDNIRIEHNQGKVYRIKPRTNLSVNKWWISDEVRYGWKFVHSDERLRSPLRRQFGTLIESDYTRAYEDAVKGMRAATGGGKRVALLVSPMLTCEEAYVLVKMAREADPRAIVGVGPVPTSGKDQTFPPSAKPEDKNAFTIYAEKCPNRRGVTRVLEAIVGQGNVLDFAGFLRALGHGSGSSDVGAVVLTGNYPSNWVTSELTASIDGKFVVLIDTLASSLVDECDVLIPGATWVEKAGTFENARGMLQGFEAAIPVIELAKSEGQIALDLLAELTNQPVEPREPETVIVQSSLGQVAAAVQVAPARATPFNAAQVRGEMAKANAALNVFVTDVKMPEGETVRPVDMPIVEL
ncbi:MAG: 2Fe-2S iron-sulfur cluster-binding protein [Planctomycetota bacterium]|nr:2Fe-2S iron-sulfur cluster-binding protein [Planctomycetota bacterium]